MKHVFKALSLLLLLIAAQQGAVVHELSHVFRSEGAALRADAGGVAETACTLCPAFAQAATPAFSHTFHLPRLGRATAQRSPEPQFSAIAAEVPAPRSRGPPSLS